MKTKLIALILIFLSSYTTKAQNIYEDKTNYVVMGFHAGYDFKISSPIAGLQVGYKLGNVFTSLNTLIPVTSNALSPKMIIANCGYNIGSFQPFVSYGYHFIGKVTEAYFRHTVDAYTSGFHFGLGVSYYPVNLPLQFSIQKQGKEIISSLTLYKAL